MPTIAIIAPGAMGSALGARLVENGARVLTSLDGRGAASRQRADAAGMVEAPDTELCAADLLLSVVPPAEAEALARRLAPTLAAAPRKAVYIDANAVSPRTVAGIAAIVAGAGAPFLDGTIIGMPPEKGAKGPRVYVSGPETGPALILRDLGLDLRVCPGDIGAASGLKMSYSGLNKGLTGLASLMVLAAAREGASEALLAELAESEPVLLARLAQRLPDMVPKAYRWGPEMQEIADFLGADRAGTTVFEGLAALFARLADSEGEVATLRAFAEEGASRRG